jgi:hypothetical protein
MWGRSMNEREAKLAEIQRMSGAELQGWAFALRAGLVLREPYEGEMEAIYRRASAMNVNLNEGIAI